MAPGVRRVPVREGRVRATLFLPPGNGPFPGIVDLFGVGGGLLEYRASLLAGKGFAVMALAYYNYDDLPKGMDIFHLEYFEEAVNYLLSHPQVKGPGIGLLGISKGGELGLAMASFLKGIKAAVIINGSVAAVGNTIHYKDETIPPVVYKIAQWVKALVAKPDNLSPTLGASKSNKHLFPAKTLTEKTQNR
ncbi:acyl-coenzyme A thioesterase 1-like protein [Cricetulus griseus]|nr:acyl-coenzyme A thioesterase 1-like protein [Cricetulus griseus]